MNVNNDVHEDSSWHLQSLTDDEINMKLNLNGKKYEIREFTLDDLGNMLTAPHTTEEIKIDEWNCTIEVQGISKAMQVELGRQLEDGETDAFDYQKQLLKVCVSDPELSDEDIDELYKKDSKVIDKIFLIINEVNGIGGSAEADDFLNE